MSRRVDGDDSLIRHLLKRFGDGWIADAKVVIVARAQFDLAVAFDGKGVVSRQILARESTLPLPAIQ
jgi:hypothetical protein